MKRQTFNEINITPLTDIFLVLLILMMVIAPILDQQGLSLAVPEYVEENQVNIKATTEEGMGFTGEGKGISAQAICLVESPTNLFNQRVDGRSCESCNGCSK